VRVHATGLDYTIRDADRLVVSRDKERQYTENWTLLRVGPLAQRGGPKYG
jgi:hypothetical protein